MTNDVSIKVHPNVDLTICTFERVLQPDEAAKKNEECHFLTEPLAFGVYARIEKIRDAAKNCRALLWSFWLISGLGSIGYFGFVAYLLHLYKGDGNVAIHAVLFAMIFCYSLTNAAITRSILLSELYDESLPYLLGFFLLAYTGLFIPSVIILFLDGRNTYGIVSCVLYGISLYGPGFYVLIICLLGILWGIICVFEVVFVYIPLLIVGGIIYLIYLACCNNMCKKPKPDEVDNLVYPPNCSVYYYDQNKTIVTQCIICLSDFKQKTYVCVGRCHIKHIFHAKCLNDWLKSKQTCPICISTQGFQ